MTKDQRKAFDRLVSQAKSLRKDLQKRAEKAIKSIEERGEQIRKRIETQAEKGFEPLVRRLSLPSKADIDALKRRVSNLEQRVSDLAKS